MIELLSCPFCGFTPNVSDDDCIYPINRITEVPRIWNLVCYEVGGGCGVSVLGDSIRDVITKWNTRK